MRRAQRFPTRGWLLAAAFAAAAVACRGAGTGQAPAPPARAAAPSPGSPMPPEAGGGAEAADAESIMRLPEVAGAWTRSRGSRTITAARIFDYMDGAGELYLGYRFDHLDVCEYAAPGEGGILVELYSMQTSDDAFGLLSNDWGGEPAALDEAWRRAPSSAAVPPHRALYGAGLLRVWAGRTYARVLAAAETAASRAAVLDIGRSIAAGQAVASPPALASGLPLRVGPDCALRPDRVWFLRSHLVLNSAYFLASDNVLDLDRSTEAVVAPYGPDRPLAGGKASRLVLVRYSGPEAAARALAHFLGSYLPEAAKGRAARPGTGEATRGGEASGEARIEDGWVGYRVSGAALALALECSSRGQAKGLVDAALGTLESAKGASR